MLKKAKLTDPTPLTYDGEPITTRHACINRSLLPCVLLETYFALNLKERTNGKVEFITTSLVDLRRSGPETLSLFAGGDVDSATIYGGYVSYQIPQIEIQSLWGIYSSREQEFEAAQAIIKDIEDLVLAETGGVIMNHNWHAGSDLFLFCREEIDSLDDFAGKEIGSSSPALSDWILGMGAEPHSVTFADVYTVIELGILDCGATWANAGFGQRWYEVTGYFVGPLLSFPFHNNVINGQMWAFIPEDLRQIIIEEAAKSDLEALRIAAIQNEVGLLKNTSYDARGAGMHAMEFVPFSEEMTFRSLNTAAMEHVVPRWVGRVGDTRHPIIADSFNNQVGPIVGLRIETDGTVVKTNEPISTTAKLPAPVPEDVADAETAHLWVYLWVNDIANPWIDASAESSLDLDGLGLDVSVRFGRQIDGYCNGSPIYRREVQPLDRCGPGEQRLLADVTSLLAATPEGPMRCQRHNTSTSDDLVHACILEDDTAHPRIPPHPPSSASLPASAPEDLSDADTADSWAYLWMGGGDGEQIKATAEASFFMDEHHLELRVHFGRRYEAFCNGSPMYIGDLMRLDCGYPEQSLADVTGVSARTTDGPMRCDRHQESIRDKLVYVCTLQSR